MPDRGMTVSPVYSDDDGSYQGSTVSYGHGGGQSDPHDYVENARGEMQYQYQPPDDYQDPEGNHWNEEQYLSDLTEAMPELPEVIQYIANAPDIPIEFAEEWNNMLDNGIEDMDRFHELLEMFCESYDAADAEVEESTPVQQWFDENFDELQQELQVAQSTEYTYEQADQMASLAADYQHGSAEQAILKAGIDLTFNKQTFDEAFEEITNKYGEAQAAAAYYSIKQRLGN